MVVISLLVIGLLWGLTWLLLKIIRYHDPDSAADAPPSSRGLPLIGETLHFLATIYSGRGFYDFVRIRHIRYGNCFKTSIFGETHVFVSSIESAKMVLNNESGKFSKRYIRSIAELVGEQSLLCADHQHHKLIRSRLISLFSATSLSIFVKQFDKLVTGTLNSWHDGSTVVILEQALEITLKAMCKMLMNIEDGEELEMLQKEITHVYNAMLAFPLKFPGTRFSRGLKARKRVMNILEMIMANRRGGKKGSYQDFLQRLMTEDHEQNSEESSRLTDTEIKDNILTMIIAGQDTTASAITWMIKYLGENQNVIDTLEAEQFQLSKKISSKGFLTLEDLNNMSYASKVVKESLRLASIVPWFPRLALRDCQIEGFKIKNGWNVNIDAKSIHQDPSLYSEPTSFNPSRFSDESKPYTFLAFGMGGRTCLGVNMAKAMMLVFLHRFITTYKWRVTDSDSSVEKWAMFSRLKSGCPVQVTRNPLLHK